MACGKLINAREQVSYVQGIQHYSLGQGQCPYAIGDGRRVGWWTGYLDARTNDKLGHIFRRYGIKFP